MVSSMTPAPSPIAQTTGYATHATTVSVMSLPYSAPEPAASAFALIVCESLHEKAAVKPPNRANGLLVWRVQVDDWKEGDHAEGPEDPAILLPPHQKSNSSTSAPIPKCVTLVPAVRDMGCARREPEAASHQSDLQPCDCSDLPIEYRLSTEDNTRDDHKNVEADQTDDFTIVDPSDHGDVEAVQLLVELAAKHEHAANEQKKRRTNGRSPSGACTDTG